MWNSMIQKSQNIGTSIIKIDEERSVLNPLIKANNISAISFCDLFISDSSREQR
jgi:hypothetical protein